MSGSFRFSLLSLFAAMLLLVSAAGWWKFHRDLYVEEVEALQTLRRDDLSVSLRRAEQIWADPPADGETIRWNAPFIAPLETVVVEGELTAEQRDVALRLPRLEIFMERLTPEQEGVARDRVRAGPVPAAYDFGSLLGRELPTIGEAELDEARLDEPMPRGEAVSDAEMRRIASEIRDTWRHPGAVPDRRLIHARKAFFLRTSLEERTLYVDDGERALRYSGYDDPFQPQSMIVHDAGKQFSYFRRSESWERTGRTVGQTFDEFEEYARHFPGDDFPYYAMNVPSCVAFGDALPQIEFERVEKLDETRYRVDFAPFAGKEEESARPNATTTSPQVLKWQTVLRSDLDWAPEEALIVGSFRKSDYETRLVQRFERIGRHVVLVERLLNDRVVNGEVRERSRTTFATEIDPAIADAAFDPATLDPTAWPDPRPLPALRWYRVTFVVSLGLFAFLIARSVVGFFYRRTAAQGPADEAERANDVRSEDDPAVAPTPGA